MTNTAVSCLIQKQHRRLEQWWAWKWSLRHHQKSEALKKLRDGSFTLEEGFTSVLWSHLKARVSFCHKIDVIAFWKWLLLSTTYIEGVCTHPLSLAFRQLRLHRINPPEGFCRRVSWCFLLLFIHTHKPHFYSIPVLDRDLKNTEVLLRKTDRRTGLFSLSRHFHKFTPMFSLISLLKCLFLRLKLSHTGLGHVVWFKRTAIAGANNWTCTTSSDQWQDILKWKSSWFFWIGSKKKKWNKNKKPMASWPSLLPNQTFLTKTAQMWPSNFCLYVKCTCKLQSLCDHEYRLKWMLFQLSIHCMALFF